MAGKKPRIPRGYLPDDVVLEILARLSVKSLLRFRCICKTWNSNITNPYFIATHLKQSKDRLLYTAPIIKKKYCLRVCDEGYNKTLEIGNSYPFSSGFIQLVGSRNGLICLVVKGCLRYSYRRPHMVYLWNYSTRKLKTLPSTCFSSSRRLQRYSYGFAYDSENDDYKIVRTALDSWLGPPSPGHRKAEVYSLRSDSWRRINNINSLFMRPDVRVSYAYRLPEFPSPLFGGYLHWLLRITDHYEHKISHMIMLFDVSNEKFRESELPPRLSDEMKRVGDLPILCEYKGKPGLFICTYVNGRPPIYTNISIWVMRDCGVAESWTKSVVVQVHEPVHSLGGTEDGALVIRKRSDWRNTILVRPETSSKRFVLFHPISCATSWKESLVPLNGTNVISWNPEIEYLNSWNSEIEYLNSWNPEIEYLKSGVMVSNLGLK